MANEHKVLRRRIRNELNHIYIWATIAKTSLEEKRFDDYFLTKGYFDIPSVRGTNKIKLSEGKVTRFLDDTVEFDLYFSIFALVIAKFESYMSQSLRIILKSEPRKLLINVKDLKRKKTIDISEVVLNESREEIVDDLIEAEIINVFYASPRKQKEYFKKVLGVTINEELWSIWFEYKATRDIIVHNNGIINDLYVSKSGTLSRGIIGERISVNQDYFDSLIVNTKRMASSFFSSRN